MQNKCRQKDLADAWPLLQAILYRENNMKLETVRKHEYIKLIEYALSNTEFSADEACSAIGITVEQFRFARHSIFDLSAAQGGVEFRSSHNYKWHLSPQAYFSYLQYLEFMHAVKSAKNANKIAIVAIIITGLLAVLSIFTTVCS